MMDRDLLVKRSQFLKSVRAFFENRDYLEVETPIVVQCPGTEVWLEYFQTEWRDHCNVPHPYFLRSSPEIHLKKIVSEDHPKIFEIARCFRNKGELAKWHEPEFNMLEFYEVGIDFESFMDLCFDFLQHCTQLNPSLPKPQSYTKISIDDAFKRWAGFSLEDGDENAWEIASKAGIVSVTQSDDFETVFHKTFLEKIEPQLSKGIFCLYNYPASMAALSEVEGGYAKRFEFYWNGQELCNAFQELRGKTENHERLLKDADLRVQRGGERLELDDSFLNAVAHLPQCCGNALGLDRLFAILHQYDDLSSTLPFKTYGERPDR